MKFRRGCELLLASALLVVLSGCRGHDSRPGEGFVSGHTDPSGEVTINKMGGGIDVANAGEEETRADELLTHSDRILFCSKCSG